MDIHQVLIEALDKRCLFHSEADFQHHLAWEVHAYYQGLNKIRLEYPLSKDGSNRWEYCDILIKSSDTIGIELKYKTKKHSEVVEHEPFELKQQGAQDLGRYDFIKDICRLEQWCTQKKISIGYAIILTNDQSYWSVPKRSNTVDKEFRIHTRTIAGELSWDSNASKGTIKGREANLALKSEYSFQWFDTPKDGFKYLLVKVVC